MLLPHTSLLLGKKPHVCCYAGFPCCSENLLRLPRGLSPTSPPSPCAHQGQTLSSGSSDGVRPCKPSPAPLQSEESQSQPGLPGPQESVPTPFAGFSSPSSLSHPPTLSTTTINALFPRTCSFPRLSVFALSVPHPEQPSLHPPQGLNHIHLAKLITNVSGQKSFPSISPSPEPLRHSLTPLHRP